MRQRRHVWALGLAAALVTVSVVQPTSSSALAVPPDVTAGVPLAPSYRPLTYLNGYVGIVASRDYVSLEHGYGIADEYAPVVAPVFRVADGSAAPPLRPEPASSSNGYVPRLSGSAGMQLIPGQAPGSDGVLEARDVESGALRWSHPVPASEWLLKVSAGAVLAIDRTLPDAALQLWRPGTPDLDLPLSVPSGALSPGPVVAADDSQIVVRTTEGVWVVDIASGTVRRVPAAIDSLARVVLTPHRLFWISTTYADASHDDIHWIQRDGSPGGHVLIDTDGYSTPVDYLPYGDRLATKSGTSDSPTSGPNFVPINLVTGQREAPIAHDVVDIRPLGDGRLVVAVVDGGPGHLTVLGDGAAPRLLAALPPVAANVTGAGLSGNTVVGSFDNHRVLVTTVDKSSPWVESFGEPLSIAGRMVSYSGHTVITALDRFGDGKIKYRVTWDDGHRDIDYTDDSMLLGRQGRFLLRFTTLGVRIEDARTGILVTTVEDFHNVAIDGHWLWTVDPRTKVITGTDLTGIRAPFTVSPAAPCSARSISVAGRWSVLTCDDGNAYAIDLAGAQAAWKLPGSLGTQYGVGNGFVTHIEQRPNSDLPMQPFSVVVVEDLSPAHQSRVYGPLDGRGSPPVASPDDTGVRRLVYADNARQLRRVDLGWLPQPSSPPDLDAPVLVRLDGPARIVSNRSLTFHWEYSDPVFEQPVTGVTSYDVRYQQAPRPGAGFGAWQEPVTWSGTTKTTVSLDAGSGVDTCLQVRARDAAGNTSPWSASVCSAVDQQAPLVSVDAGPAVVAVTTTNTATVRYTARDASGVRSYDVVERFAGNGQPPGTWQRIATATTRQTAPLRVTPGGQGCVMVRARDVAGNVSPWSPARCVVVPLDDRALAATGAVSRLSSTLALARTQTRLDRAGASLHRSGQTGSRIGVFVVRGPRQGAVDVKVGKVTIQRVYLSAPTWRRQLVWLPARRFTGTVTISSAKAAPARIDALVVLR